MSFGVKLYARWERWVERQVNRRCLGAVRASQGSRFYKEAKVQNLSGRPEAIRIGSNTHVRGELTVYPYGEGITIGNDCYVGEYSIIRSGDKITIGNSVLIAHSVTIMDTDSHEIAPIERHASFAAITQHGTHDKGAIQTAPIVIEDHAWISYGVSILKGVTIGRGAIVGAGSVVTKDVAPFAVVAGNPARLIKQLERC